MQISKPSLPISITTAFLIVVGVGCSGDEPPVIGPGCDDLGTSDAALRVETVLQATDRLETNATALAGELEVSCGAMASDLGVMIPDPTVDQLQVEATCGALAAEIDSILTAGLPAGASLVIGVEPPACSIDVAAAANCAADCDASLMGMAEVSCTDGTIVGDCSASCSGECRIEGTVTCAAECRGTCDGTCAGNCTGTCDGTCSAEDSMGNCIGTCDGTCAGTCSGDCTGTCEGTCVADVDGMCMGRCAGDCSVEMDAPRCEGEADIMADASCTASCETELRADAQCTEPRVSVSTSMPVDFAAEARLADLIGVLQTRWPSFLAASARVEGTLAAGSDLASAVADLESSASGIGAQAAACLAVAADTATGAVSTLSASADASVTVTASVEVSGGG